jgi:hypothetical protein
MGARIVLGLVTAALLAVAPRPSVRAEPTPRGPVETPAQRAARQARERRAAGGHPGVWAVSRRIAREADAAARALSLPLPEVITWYRPPGRCRRCSNAHARGGVTLVLPSSPCGEGASDCAALGEARLALARELSRRLGRHHRVSVVEPGPRPDRERHTSFRNGMREGRPFTIRRRHDRDVIVVRPDALLPPPPAVVFGEPEGDGPPRNVAGGER